MVNLPNVFRELFRRSTPSPEQLSDIERRTYGPCSLCGEVGGHDRAQLGSIIVGESDASSLEMFEAAVRGRDWTTVASHQEWDGAADEVVYSVIRCPWSYQLCLVRLDSFASMDLDDQVTAREVLSESESKHLETQLALEWRRM